MAGGPGNYKAIRQQPKQSQHADREYDQGNENFQEGEASLPRHHPHGNFNVIGGFHSRFKCS